MVVITKLLLPLLSLGAATRALVIPSTFEISILAKDSSARNEIPVTQALKDTGVKSKVDDYQIGTAIYVVIDNAYAITKFIKTASPTTSLDNDKKFDAAFTSFEKSWYGLAETPKTSKLKSHASEQRLEELKTLQYFVTEALGLLSSKTTTLAQAFKTDLADRLEKINKLINDKVADVISSGVAKKNLEAFNDEIKTISDAFTNTSEKLRDAAVSSKLFEDHEIGPTIFHIISTSQYLTLALDEIKEPADPEAREKLEEPFSNFESAFQNLTDANKSKRLSDEDSHHRLSEFQSLRYFVVETLEVLAEKSDAIDEVYKGELVARLEGIADLKDQVTDVVTAGVNDSVADPLKDQINQIFAQLVGAADALRGAVGPHKVSVSSSAKHNAEAEGKQRGSKTNSFIVELR